MIKLFLVIYKNISLDFFFPEVTVLECGKSYNFSLVFKKFSKITYILKTKFIKSSNILLILVGITLNIKS